MFAAWHVTVGVSVTMLLTHLSAAPSIAFPSPVTAQPPFASAFPIAVLNFISAAMRQAVSALVAPVANAFCQHLSLAPIFFAAALFFATAHFCAGVALAWRIPALTTSRIGRAIACASRPIGFIVWSLLPQEAGASYRRRAGVKDKVRTPRGHDGKRLAAASPAFHVEGR